jgi:hypothetical protein
MTQTLKLFIANLKQAAWNKETLTVGGGTFDHKELREILDELKRLKQLDDADDAHPVGQSG